MSHRREALAAETVHIARDRGAKRRANEKPHSAGALSPQAEQKQERRCLRPERFRHDESSRPLHAKEGSKRRYEAALSLYFQYCPVITFLLRGVAMLGNGCTLFTSELCRRETL